MRFIRLRIDSDFDKPQYILIDPTKIVAIRRYYDETCVWIDGGHDFTVLDSVDEVLEKISPRTCGEQ